MADPRERIQMLAGQLQNTMQQVHTVDTQIREIQATITALEIQDESRPVYRQIGPLLLHQHQQSHFLCSVQSLPLLLDLN